VAAGGNGERVFTCPAHFCHACRVSGDAQRMLRCWRCPTAYHSRCVSVQYNSTCCQDNSIKVMKR
jgi:hypothetical protein